MTKRSDVIKTEGILVQELHRNASACLMPYIEQSEYGQVHTDPASAFFDFIIQVVSQIGPELDDSCILECMNDAFAMLDNDLTNSGYQLDSNVVDVNLVPRIEIKLLKADQMLGDADSLMRMSLDMPMIRTIIAKRRRYA